MEITLGRFFLRLKKKDITASPIVESEIKIYNVYHNNLYWMLKNLLRQQGCRSICCRNSHLAQNSPSSGVCHNCVGKNQVSIFDYSSGLVHVKREGCHFNIIT